jgi:hypothetical protein
MIAPNLHIGDECYINGSPAFPELAGAKCTIVGELKLRQEFNSMGHFVGLRESYLIEVNGQQMCAPPRLLREKTKRSDWGMLRGIWQPDRTRKVTRPTAWKEFK